MEELTEYTKMELLSEPQEEEEEEEKKKAEEEEEEEEEVETDTANHTHTNAHTHTKENAHTIDFILVNRLTHTHPHTQTTHAYMEAHTETHIDLTGSSKVERDGEKVEGAEEERNEKWRRNFELELEREGLVLEEAFVEELPLRFVKIHAPFEVCTRYAEILKLRIPMKECDEEIRMSFFAHAEEVFKEMFPGLPPLEFRPPQVIQDVREGVGSLLSFTHLDPKIFPPANRHFTAIYARDKDYLFDLTPEFFRPSIKARIIDFIIRRKSFDGPQEGEEEEEEEAEVVQEGEGGGGGRGGRGKDNYNFGIEKLLAEEVYLAAYPVHDGDLHIRDPPGPPTSDPPPPPPRPPTPGRSCTNTGLVYTISISVSLSTILRTILGSRLGFMCPLCDKFCDFWDLSETCFHAKFTYLVDNPATIFFTAFMSLW
ncbi:anoctamin-5-like, partial [Eriocheir sinensis]|uniref:anoctamin-5-like n=1 Tax=Eriocheir sinensis TaxID=95602 RepID=UPI0021C78C01